MQQSKVYRFARGYVVIKTTIYNNIKYIEFQYCVQQYKQQYKYRQYQHCKQNYTVDKIAVYTNECKEPSLLCLGIRIKKLFVNE